jgi:hypothetical protein
MVELQPIVNADRDHKSAGWLVISDGCLRAIAGEWHSDVVLLAIVDMRLLVDGKAPRFASIDEAKVFLETRLGSDPNASSRIKVSGPLSYRRGT